VSRSLVLFPEPELEQPCVPVPADTSVAELVALRDEMLTVMHRYNGVGLAAPQVGVNWRLFVSCAPTATRHGEPRVFINPVVVPVPDLPAGTDFLGRPREPRPGPRLLEMDEGCLSFPGIWVKRQRYDQVLVHYLDIEGWGVGLASSSQILDGLLAQCAQHEAEHLDGVTFAKNWDGKRRADVKKWVARPHNPTRRWRIAG
jgi:peptide deformylase